MIMDVPNPSPSSPEMFAAATSSPFDTPSFPQDDAMNQWPPPLSPSYHTEPLFPNDLLSPPGLAMPEFDSPYGTTTPASSQDSGVSLPGVSIVNPASTQQLRYCKIEGCTNTKGFRRESDLLRHHSKHTRPYGCASTDCPMSFASKADMIRHRREVHGFDETTGGPSSDFRCPVPSCKRHRRGFARLWNMQQHVKKMHGESTFSKLNASDKEYVQTPATSADSPASIDSEGGPRTPESATDPNSLTSSPLVRQHSAPGMIIGVESPRLPGDKDERLRKLESKLHEATRKRNSLAEKRGRMDEEMRNYDDMIDNLKFCIVAIKDQ